MLLGWVLSFAPARAGDDEWVKVSMDHFTILTPAGGHVARKWAIELEQFRRGLQAAVPVPVHRLRPVTVVLFRNERDMGAFAPLEKGQPVKIGGFFVRANDINTIMLSLARNDTETRRVIFHEAVHWHLSARDHPMPLWLAEGLAEVYATFTTDSKTYSFGIEFEEHVARLREESLLPLPKLVGLGRDSLLYNEGTRTSIFYAQAWAFVHFLFYGEKSPGPTAVQRYLDLLPRVRSPDDAFLTAFGSDYSTLERQLRRYITNGRYRKHVLTRSTDDLGRELKVVPALAADIELAKGSLLLVTRTPEDAEPFLGRAAELAPNDSRPWELLGNVAMSRHDFETARTVLTKALDAGSRSHLVYHNLAVARLPELTQPWIPNQTIDSHLLDVVAADFRKAIELSPTHVASYEGLASVVRGLTTYTPADLELLTRGLAQAPGNTMIEAGLAAVEVRAGRASDGRARLERLCAKHPAVKSPGMIYARRLLETETFQSEVDRITALSTENRFDDAIAIADGALGRQLEPAWREFMENVRRRMGGYKIVCAAVELANRGELAAAKKSLGEVLANDPDVVVMKEAQRVLQEISRESDRNPLEQ
jgi:tetratricopeptide (TPR) repeat protein